MSNFSPDETVSISVLEEGKCLVRVNPKSAQSLIRFLTDRGIELDPPEGGVARDPKYQVEMAGVPRMHEFRALTTLEKLEELKVAWESASSRPVA